MGSTDYDTASSGYADSDFTRLGSDLLHLRSLMRGDMTDLLSSPGWLVRRLDSLESDLPSRSDIKDLRSRLDELGRGLVAVSSNSDLSLIESRLSDLSSSTSSIRDDLASIRSSLGNYATLDSIHDLRSRLDYICENVELACLRAEAESPPAPPPRRSLGRILGGITLTLLLATAFLVLFFAVSSRLGYSLTGSELPDLVSPVILTYLPVNLLTSFFLV